MGNGGNFPSPTAGLHLGTAPSDAGTIHSAVDPGPVGPRRIWQEPDGATHIRNDADTAWVDIVGVSVTPDLAAVLAAGNDAGALGISNLADPVADQDAATKDYVDDALAAFVPASPLVGAPGTNSTGGSVAYNPGGSDVGGTAILRGGDASPNNDNGGGAILQGGTGDQGRVGGTVLAEGGLGGTGAAGVKIIGRQAEINVGASNTKTITLAGEGIDIDGRGGNSNSVALHGGSVEIQLLGSNVIISGLPTSDPGVSGALWINSGVLNVSP